MLTSAVRVTGGDDRAVVIECSFLAWKNRWRIEVTGDRGQLEMDGLTKWGGSELIVRRRKLPSGVPDETRETVPGPDQTWAGDLRHFEELSNTEVAAVLGIQKSAASNRYVRALTRLRDVLASIPGFLE